jgi:hypothetical protein
MPNRLPFREIPPPAFQNDFVSIIIFEAYSLLLLKWKRQITLPERKTGFLKGLELTNQHKIRFWLIDDLEIYLISEEEKAWILTDWVEVSSKSSILKLAVVSPDYYPSLVANTEFTGQGKEQYQATGEIRHEVFTDYTSALHWFYPAGFAGVS